MDVLEALRTIKENCKKHTTNTAYCDGCPIYDERHACCVFDEFEPYAIPSYIFGGNA